MTIDDALADGLPEPAAQALREWAVQSANSYTLSRWYVSGRSGAIVCAVREHRPYHDDRKIILKLDTVPDAAQAKGEYARQLDALNESPAKFAPEHLVRPVREPVRASEGYWLTFQELATGAPTAVGLADLDALSSLLEQLRGIPAQAPASTRCDSETFATICARIVGSVLGDWASPRRTQDMSVPEYLERHLGHSLAPGGGLARLAAGLNDRWITFPGEPGPLPNPLVLATQPELSLGQRVPALIGRAHGDLHEDNILIPVRPWIDASGYRLIDLSKYRPDAPLARDPVHFVLHMIARSMADLSDPQCRALIDVLLDPGGDQANQVPGWLALVIRRVHAAAEAWAGSLVDEWRAQVPLTLLACALIYVVRRSTPSASRDWFLRLAARAAAHHLRRSGSAPTGASGSVARPLLDRSVPAASARPDRDWVARLCVSLPELRRRAEGPGLGPRLTTLVTAALSEADSSAHADRDRQLGQLMWELGVDSTRTVIPGISAGRPVVTERYECPVSHCSRSEARVPSGQVPFCHLNSAELRRQLR